MLPSFLPLRDAFLADESRMLEALIPVAKLPPDAIVHATATARALVEAVRARQQ